MSYCRLYDRLHSGSLYFRYTWPDTLAVAKHPFNTCNMCSAAFLAPPERSTKIYESLETTQYFHLLFQALPKNGVLCKCKNDETVFIAVSLELFSCYRNFASRIWNETIGPDLMTHIQHHTAPSQPEVRLCLWLCFSYQSAMVLQIDW